MAKIDISKMSLKELNGLRDDVDKAIQSFHDRKRTEALSALEDVAKEHGYSLDEIIGGRVGKKPRPKSKSAPKYRNPNDPSQTWSGRGRQPQWFKQALADGKNPDALAI